MSSDAEMMREIERDEAWLRGFESPVPSEGTVVRVKAEVRLAAHEGWLSEMDGPAPSLALKGRVRGAIRDELARQAGQEAEPAVIPMRPAAWHRTFGALSAAALVGISVGIARFTPGPVVVPSAGVQADVESLTSEESTLLAEVDEVIQEISSDLSALESGSTWTERWGEYENEEDDDEPLKSLYEALESLMDDIEVGAETS